MTANSQADPAHHRAATSRFPTRLELLTALGLSIGLTLLSRVLLPVVTGFGGDDRHYVQMAMDPADPVRTPFAFRVLTPWVVRLVGADPIGSYHAISLGFLAVGGFFTYLIARGLQSGHLAALIACAGLLTLRGWLFNVYNPFLADPAAMSLTAAAFAALVWRMDPVLPAITVLWALSREVWAGFALPAYMWLRERLVDVRTGLRIVLVLFPAFIVYEMVIHLVPHEGIPGLGRIAWPVVQAVLDARLSDAFGWWVLYTFAGSLSVWWVFALAAPRAGGALWWWLLPVFGQLLLGADWSRFAMYAFVVVLPVGAIAIWQHRRRYALIALAALQLLPTVVDLMVDNRLKLNQDQPSVWISATLMIAAAILIWAPDLHPRFAQRSSPSPPSRGS